MSHRKRKVSIFEKKVLNRYRNSSFDSVYLMFVFQ